jgi:peptidoglycan/xylan/chitin deacetylase (PgdA/CDA1 family)
MHKYFIKTPWLVKQLFPSYIWDIPTDEKVVYLTFDDGPHPAVTPWVLDELKKYNASATFFCIGNNVKQHSKIYDRIKMEGHAIGNHTYNHVNGWKANAGKYISDIRAASELIDSSLFRPPYGRIRTNQAKLIPEALGKEDAKIIMWDVLSGDFDKDFTGKQCFDHVVLNVSPGSIVVFHDSEKAWTNLKYALPESLKYLEGEGYMFKKLDLNRELLK